jgi:predicted glycosyltransferase involved in capsule biosynthesis
MFSIIYPYYNDQKLLNKHIEYWNSYSKIIRKNIHIILVDDASKIRPDLSNLTKDINLTLLRINENIEWNQPGAKNLGFKFVINSWVLTLDIDHYVSESLLKEILEFEKKKGHVYYLGEKTFSGIIRHPHPNSFIIHSSLFKKLGGYDEDFCGNYGYDDAQFNLEIKYSSSVEVLENLFLITIDKIRESELKRDTKKNKKLFKKKKKLLLRNKYIKKRGLRFDWEIIEVRTCT